MSSENIPELDLYTAILERVMDLEEIKHFDYYADQLERERDARGDTHEWPAVFLRWKPIAWQRLGQGRKHAVLTGFLVIASKNVMKAQSGKPAEVRDKALANFGLAQKVEELIDGWRPQVTGAGTITYEQTDPVESLQGIASHIVTFKLRITNDTVIEKYTLADPKPQLVVHEPEEEE